MEGEACASLSVARVGTERGAPALPHQKRRLSGGCTTAGGQVGSKDSVLAAIPGRLTGLLQGCARAL